MCFRGRGVVVVFNFLVGFFCFSSTMETLGVLLALLCVLTGAQTQVQRPRFAGKFAIKIYSAFQRSAFAPTRMKI